MARLLFINKKINYLNRMNMKKKLAVALASALSVSLLLSGCGGGDKKAGEKKVEYPTKNITMICPWGAGGGTDAILRALCKAAEKETKGKTITVSNITGGGFIENIPRILSEDLNCTIEKGSWDKGDLFTFIENTGAIAEEELYRSFNMGIGMVLIVGKDEAEKALAYLNEKTDEKATVIGEITAGEGKTVLK